MSTEDEIVRAACANRSTAIPIEIRCVAFKNGDFPLANKCHDNVARWIQENPGYIAVRGWLDSSGILDAHSIVADSEGNLFDITPRDPRILFIRHNGSDEEFFALLPASNQIHCVLYL